MASLLIENIARLVQVEESPRTWVAGADMAQLPCVDRAYLLVEDGRIAGWGPTEQAPATATATRTWCMPGAVRLSI